MKTSLSTINLVVAGIIFLGLACFVLVGIIAVDDSPGAVPEALWAVIGGIVGALSAMLARTSITPEEPPAPIAGLAEFPRARTDEQIQPVDPNAR